MHYDNVTLLDGSQHDLFDQEEAALTSAVSNAWALINAGAVPLGNSFFGAR